jgi:hypothetical protein
MTLGLNVQFNRSAINLLVSRNEVTLGPSHLQRTCCCARPWRNTARKGEAYDPRPENHGYDCMESIGIALDRGTS